MDAGHEDRWQRGSSSDAVTLLFIVNISPAFTIGSNSSTNSSFIINRRVQYLEDIGNIHDRFYGILPVLKTDSLDNAILVF